MEKITICGKDYTLPELNFGVLEEMADLIDGGNIRANNFTFLKVVVAYVSGNDINAAKELLNKECKTMSRINELLLQVDNWFGKSSFFTEEQAETVKQAKTTQPKKK